MGSTAALAGVTVLDFATVGPAARCSRILADYGADVVKIGAPPKAGAVQIRPAFFAYGAHRGMKRIELDLRSPEGCETFLRLAATADVVIESFRPGVVARLGIGYDDVRAVNDQVVYCSTSGYGQTGPAATWAGHDLNYLAVAGFLDCTTQRADGGPPIPGATVADSAGGGMHAAIAILAALLRRQAHGEGAYLDVSVAEGVLALMALQVDEYLATGTEPGPGHNVLTGRYACYDSYRCADGKWLAVAAIEPAFFANLCRGLGLEQWTAHQTDDDRQDEIRADFRAAFARRPRDEWVAELAPADTCVAPVYSVADVVNDAQFRARGAFVEAVDEEHGVFEQVGAVLAGGEAASGPHRVAPPGPTDTDEVLRAAGFTDDDVATLRESGAIA